MPLFNRKVRERAAAEGVYGAIVAQARSPALYTQFGVPDTLEGRFEMIVLLTCLYFRRLRSEDARIRNLGQAVFDAMFRDMDASLRELGVGDLSVPKKIKAMGEAFYGRATAYDAALAGADGEVLAEALARNIWPDTPGAQSLGAALAAWVRAGDRALAAQPAEDLCREGPRFPAPQFGNEAPVFEAAGS